MMQTTMERPRARRERPPWVEDVLAVAARRRWGQLVRVVGWVHLGFFLAMEALVVGGDYTHWHYPALWATEVATVLAVARAISGPGWYRDSPMAAAVVRIWGTYLILAFNLATLNELTGWSLDWFKPIWATLSTFGFATMAWLFDLRFLIVAVQMWLTGLLMVMFPEHNYLIHGLSWWAALQAIGPRLDPPAHGEAATNPIHIQVDSTINLE